MTKTTKQEKLNNRPVIHMSASHYDLLRNYLILSNQARHDINKILTSSEDEVADYLVDNVITSKNIVIANYDTLQKNLHISRSTIHSALVRLQAMTLIKRFSNVIYLSPDWVCDNPRKRYFMLKNIYQAL